MISEVQFDILQYTFENTLQEYVEIVNSGADVPNNLARFLMQLEVELAKAVR